MCYSAEMERKRCVVCGEWFGPSGQESDDAVTRAKGRYRFKTRVVCGLACQRKYRQTSATVRPSVAIPAPAVEPSARPADPFEFEEE